MTRNIVKTPAPAGGACDLRCGCGSLLARATGDAVELKCRRCKRTWTIPVGRAVRLDPRDPAPPRPAP
jgi:hypothetical protein